MTGFFAISSIVFGNHGDPPEIRTPDTLLKRQVLCRLSYWVIFAYIKNRTEPARHLAGMAGFEPTISESKSGVLPLHYIPISGQKQRGSGSLPIPDFVGWVKGFEPSTPGTTIRCSPD